MHIHRTWGVVGAAALIAATLSSGAAAAHDGGRNPIKKIDHIVVIYQENHSFDNLYGRWEGVDGLERSAPGSGRSRSTRPATCSPVCGRTTPNLRRTPRSCP